MLAETGARLQFSGDVSTLERLLDASADELDLEARDKQGRTALICAVLEGPSAAVARLQGLEMRVPRLNVHCTR